MNIVSALAGVVIKELYRRKDFYVLFVLTALLTLLMGSATLTGDLKVVRYLKEICLVLIWISALVIAITTTARQIPSERENRTIFPLLAKPVTRAHLVLGKFAGCWLATGLALVVFYVFLGVIAATRESSWPVVPYVQALWLHWVMLGVVIALTLWGSVVFSAVAPNVTIVFIVVTGILLLGRHLNKVALQQPEPWGTVLYAVYYVIPHLEWFDVRDFLVHDQPPLAGWVIAVATLYALAYMGLFLTAAWLVFRRKPLH